MYQYSISIIIPHFNSSDTLSTLLKTIPDNDKIEVIVVDDKSTKHHVETIKDMQTDVEHRSFEFLINDTEIKSAGTCRNIGIDNANGKWLFFADADDYFQDNFYESIEQYLDSGNDVVFFPPMSIYLDTKEEAVRHIRYKNIIEYYCKQQNMKNYLHLKYKMHPPWLKLIRSEFIYKNIIKFDEFIASNDVLFSTKVGHFMNKFTIASDSIYMVTTNKGSLTMNYSENVIDARVKTYISWYTFLKENLSKDDLLSMQINSLGVLSASLYHSKGMFLKVLYILLKEGIPIFSLESMKLGYTIPKLYNRFIGNKVNKKYSIK